MVVPSNVCCQVQVLVIYLGDMRWKWLPLATLLPFQKHRQEKVAEADTLTAAKRFTKPILFHKALKVTTCMLYACTTNRGLLESSLRCKQVVPRACYVYFMDIVKGSS